MGYTLMVVATVALAMLVTSHAQVTTFSQYGTSLAGGQQQLYQTAGTPVQGLRLQLTNPAGFNLLRSVQQTGAQPLPVSTFNQRYVLQIKVKPTAHRILNYETHLVPTNDPTNNAEAGISSPFGVQQPAFSTVLPQQQAQHYQQQPQQHQQQLQQYQQPLQLSNSILASAAQFRNTAPQTFTENSTPSVKNTPTTGVLGVAFSPAADVSQLRFSGSFANYSY